MALPSTVLERDPTPPHPAVPDFLAPVPRLCSHELMHGIIERLLDTSCLKCARPSHALAFGPHLEICLPSTQPRNASNSHGEGMLDRLKHTFTSEVRTPHPATSMLRCRALGEAAASGHWQNNFMPMHLPFHNAHCVSCRTPHVLHPRGVICAACEASHRPRNSRQSVTDVHYAHDANQSFDALGTKCHG